MHYVFPEMKLLLPELTDQLINCQIISLDNKHSCTKWDFLHFCQALLVVTARECLSVNPWFWKPYLPMNGASDWCGLVVLVGEGLKIIQLLYKYCYPVWQKRQGLGFDSIVWQLLSHVLVGILSGWNQIWNNCCKCYG